jgi:parallel beta-helix repeat protein
MKMIFLKLESIIIVSVLFASVVSPLSFAKNEPLSPLLPSNGTILYVGGSGPGNFSKIQDAVDNASEGDIVFVYSGLYKENILIRTSIQLKGMETSTTIIDGGTSGTVVTISADHTIIQGFTIQNAKDNVHCAGIEISNAENALVLGNIIQDNGQLGIYLEGPDSSGTTITMNMIRNNSYGIYLFDSPKTLILANTISGNGEGVYVVGSFTSRIINNTVSNRGLGIHVENTSACLSQVIGL